MMMATHSPAQVLTDITYVMIIDYYNLFEYDPCLLVLLLLLLL